MMAQLKLNGSLMDYKTTVFVLFVVLAYFLWMDVALYYHIQAKHHTKASAVDQDMNTGKLFSPFNGLTVKMMMIDQPNHYIHTPAASIFNQFTHFSEIFTFISPNMISVFHMAVSVVSMLFVSSQSLLMRQIGVLLFEFRAFLDSLDGVVYRARAHQTSNISNFGSIGYIVDGVADTFGCVVLLIACFLFLRKSPTPRLYASSYLPLPTTWTKGDAVPTVCHITQRRIAFVLCCFAFQLAVSAAFWDRYIAGYHFLLETGDNANQKQMLLQDEVLKSVTMWMVIWFWKIMNSHALLEMLLLSIFVDKLWEFVTCIQYIGFLALSGLITVTECHYRNAQSYIGRASGSIGMST